MQVFALRQVIAKRILAPRLTCFISLKNGFSPHVRRVMKVTGVVLLVACLHVNANVASQTVNLSEEDAPFVKVIESIERQTDYTFFYKTNLLRRANKVTIKVNEMPLRLALDLCFQNQPFSYTIFGKNITIIPKINGNVEASPHRLIDINGQVRDVKGQPIVGATVAVKGSNKSSSTDADGMFRLAAIDENGAIIVSHIQYETETIALNGKASLNVVLKIKFNSLDEMQVIAYGSTSKRFNTGNIASVKAADIQNQPVQNVLLALQGRVPGLLITQKSGVSGGAIATVVQGQNSINYGNDPLYIVDGVPILSQLPSTGVDYVLGQANSSGGVSAYGNPLSYLNPSDIESVEILKDADATSIYGARASNGAILITTKKGKEGKAKLDISLQNGFGNVARKIEMLNSRQYLDMRYEALRNDGIDINSVSPTSIRYSDLKLWDTTRYTDWQDELIGRTAKYTNVNGSISGGSAHLQYIVGGSYNKQTTVFPGNLYDEQVSLHFNLNTISNNKKFKLSVSNTYLIDNNKLPQIDLTASAILTEPIAPTTYLNGDLNWAPNAIGTSTWTNPLTQVIYRSYENRTKNLISNAQLAYSIISGLEVKANLGYTNIETDDYTSMPLLAYAPERRITSQRTATYGSRSISTWIVEPQITFEKKVLKGVVKALIGTTIQQSQTNTQALIGTGYNSDAVLRDSKSAATVSVGSTYDIQYKYNAAFGRINYNLSDKYIINLTGRRDGSTRFGNKNQFHNFWSVGGAWIFNRETFFKLPFVTFGKLRASYGTTGNDQISDYIFLSLYNITLADVPYQNTTGLSIVNLPNPYIQWEETKKLQAGLELGFIRDNILVNVTYFRNRSSNQLLSYSLPMMTGSQLIQQNFPATIQNSGWEMSLTSKVLSKGRLSWNIVFNMTFPRNKLTSFPNLQSSSYSNDLVVGQPIGLLKMFDFNGVDPATGKYQYVDVHGNNIPFPDYLADRSIWINTLPKYYGGVQNTVQYNGFQVDFLFQFVKQVGKSFIYNNGTTIGPGIFRTGSSNQPAAVLNRWQKPGDLAESQSFSANLATTDDMINMNSSDAAYSDASFVRLKNLSISWQTPFKWNKEIGLKNARLFMSGQNLLTITNYRGLDPENQTLNSLPPLRVITLGIQVGL